MLDKLLKTLFGTKFDREIKKIQPIVDEINRIYETLHDLSEEELVGKTAQFKQQINDACAEVRAQIAEVREELHITSSDSSGDSIEDLMEELKELEEEELAIIEEQLDAILPEAFAVVKEACRRMIGQKIMVTDTELTWDMIPYDVQLIGGIVLHQGKIAEMATGEGKTLVASMPVYLNALAGKGVHLITVNDYLARRDSEWMGALFKYLGLTVGCIQTHMPPHVRKKEYDADITYGTNSEFGFDYLRDNMAISMEERVQRTHHYAVIDEVDSVLIDEARTPLIISGVVERREHRYDVVSAPVRRLVKRQKELVGRFMREGKKLYEEDPQGNEYEAATKFLLVHRGDPKNKQLLKLYKENPAIQKTILAVEGDYMRDRRLSEIDDQLLYHIDEKGNGVVLSEVAYAELSPNDPDLFRLPDLSVELQEIEDNEDLSPEEKEAAKEKLHLEHADKSEKLHNIHQLLRAYALFEKDEDYVVQDGKVIIVDTFTGRLMPSRRFSDGLHQALEAKENVEIGEETQTLATITLQNYFRMYHKLAGMTGTAETEESEFYEIYKLEVIVIPTNEPIRRQDYDDVILRTKAEKFKAVLDEIEAVHKTGRPVLVGTISVDASESLSRLLKRRKIPHEVLNAKQHQREAEIVAKAGRNNAVTIATNMAGRGTDIKLEVYPDTKPADFIPYREWLNRESNLNKGVVNPECIAIRKTSLDSGKYAYKKDIPWCCVACAVKEECQKAAPGPTLCGKSERMFECVENMPCGLHIIGTERHESRRIDRQLRGRSGRQGDPGSSRFYLSLEDDLMRLFGSDRIANVMSRLKMEDGEVITHKWITSAIGKAQTRVEGRNFEIRKHLLEYDDVMNNQREVIYDRRLYALEGGNLRQDIIEKFQEQAKNIVLRHTDPNLHPEEWDWEALQLDFRRIFLLQFDDKLAEVVKNQADLMDKMAEVAKKIYEDKESRMDPAEARWLERIATISTIDELWRDHLYEIDQLKEGINLRAYGQRDPVVEYKKEAYNMFVELLDRIDEQIVSKVMRYQPQTQNKQVLENRRRVGEISARHTDRTGSVFQEAAKKTRVVTNRSGDEKPQPVKRQEPKVGRNDPCPCGSGKKYKKCHGRNQAVAT